MTLKIAKKTKARQLRRQGKSFSEIMDEVGHIPKGTLSGWLKDIRLTKEQQQRINRKKSKGSDRGRQKGAWTNHLKRQKRIATIQKRAEREFQLFREDRIFLAGLMLYIAEGSKKHERFHFSNSDPYLVKFFIDWVIRFGKIERKDLKLRLYIHRVYADENCESFWSEFLSMPRSQFLKTVFKPSSHTKKKNERYKGCIRVEAPGSEFYWKVMKWQELFYREV